MLPLESQAEALYTQIEQGVSMIGATAIEDRLQEGVPECIASLQEAGIKTWVLTGDRLETAINIGYACRLLKPSYHLIVIKEAERVEEQLKELQSAGQAEGEPGMETGAGAGPASNVALIITGTAMQAALEKGHRKLFVMSTRHAKAVICCRVSPRQKAQAVCLVQTYLNALCLSIGDGANDVSMLQAANIGVGIAGEEGMQAVMASDYALTRFKHLQRLLFVHGRWAYLRTAGATLAVFYKNIAFVGVQVWYQFYCAFTAQYSYDYVYMLFYNAVFSILPVMAIGFLDKDIPCHEGKLPLGTAGSIGSGNAVTRAPGARALSPKAIETAPGSHLPDEMDTPMGAEPEAEVEAETPAATATTPHNLPLDQLLAMSNPLLYRSKIRYSLALFSLACLDAVWQTLTIFYIVYAAYSDSIADSLLLVGNVTAFTMIISVNATMLFMAHFWTLWSAAAMLASLGLLFGFVLIYMLIQGTQGSLWGSWRMFTDAKAYLAVTLGIMVSILPRLLIRVVKSEFWPDALDKVARTRFVRTNDGGLVATTAGAATTVIRGRGAVGVGHDGGGALVDVDGDEQREVLVKLV